MHNNIKDKSILLLCENFYDYDKAIVDELYKLGAKNVFLKNIKYFRSSFREMAGFSLFSFLRNPFERRCWTSEFEQEIQDLHFDIFLCIENTCFVKSFMRFLRAKNPQIKTVLFLWDTYKTQQGGFKDYRFLFDKVYSFDRDDAEKYDMEYYPDFYIPQHPDNEALYDISFVGTANGSSTLHRFKLIDYVNKFCEANGLRSMLYLRVNIPVKTKNPLKIIKRRFDKLKVYRNLIAMYSREKWLHGESLPLEQCNKLQSQAHVLLDLNHRNRQGMTINCITALAQGQKLITTNKRIKEEAFYNPNMIYVMDEDNPHLDISFWSRPNEKIDMSHLRLDNWLLHILTV